MCYVANICTRCIHIVRYIVIYSIFKVYNRYRCSNFLVFFDFSHLNIYIYIYVYLGVGTDIVVSIKFEVMSRSRWP